MVQGDDGNFYGTTPEGGANNYGTVFRITPDGILTSLISFNFANGQNPQSGLVRGNDGALYGTTYWGGVAGDGTVFKITTNGVLTTLISFNVSNGASPSAKLIQGKNGNFYGTTLYGGAFDQGTVFKMGSNGNLTTLISFNSVNIGTNSVGPFTPIGPSGGLAEGSDGNLYGTTTGGGYVWSYLGDKSGTVFRVVMPSSNAPLLIFLSQELSGNSMVVSWPTNQVGFTLQVAMNSLTNWIDSTNAPAVVGAQFTVTNSISGSAQFYRLHKP